MDDKMDDKKELELLTKQIEALSNRPSKEVIEESVWDEGKQDLTTRSYERDNAKMLEEAKEHLAQVESRISFKEQQAREKRDAEERKEQADKEAKADHDRKVKESEKAIKKQEQTDKINEQKRKEWLLSDIKKIYRSGSLFERFLLNINGKAPKWRTIENYSSEELEFLIDFSKGETLQQRDHDRTMDLNGNYRSNSKKSSRNWNNFVSLLRNRQHIKNKMEFEKDIKNSVPYVGRSK